VAGDEEAMTKKAIELSPKQRAAAVLTAKGMGTGATADHVGVNRTTVIRWKQTELFQNEVKEISEAIHDVTELAKSEAKASAAQLLPKAVETLQAGLDAMHTVSAGGGTMEEDWANRMRSVESLLKMNEVGGYGKPQAQGGGQAAAVVQVVISPDVLEKASKRIGDTITVQALPDEVEEG
jgi:hypothetical protein